MIRLLFLIAVILSLGSYGNETLKISDLFSSLEGKGISKCSLPSTHILRIACTKKCNKNYVTALKEAAKELNYRIRIFSLDHSKEIDYKTLPSKIDAILSPGGHDIDPKYFTKSLSERKKKSINKLFKKYGKTNTRGKLRDKFEYRLFRQYFSDDRYRKIPILGICYGAQMLAAVKNIPLYVHIPADINLPARRKINDTVALNSNSSLYPYIGDREFKGYKNHHQAIDLNFFNSHKSQFASTMITATSNKGKIAEVLEFRDRPAIGVQFHPERSNRKTKDAVFKKFLIDACKKAISQK